MSRLRRLADSDDERHDTRKRRRRLYLQLRRSRRSLVALGVMFVFFLTLLLRHTSSSFPDTSGSTMGKSGTPQARAARLTEAGAAAAAGAFVTRPALPNEARSATHSVKGGMLHVDPDSRVHPIYQIIHDARAAWDAKLARQSKTLREATDEYLRRYRRAPPVGFDKWWKYVVENKVQLPDEYDQIDKDLRLFRALRPNDILRRIGKASQESGTFTIKVRNGLVDSTSNMNRTDVNHELHAGRMDGQLELIRPIAEHIPDMTAVYTIHDTPFNFISYAHQEELLEHVEEDEYIDSDDKVDHMLRGWGIGCPITSPLRHFSYSGERLPLGSSETEDKTFIIDHKASMDPCTHPELVRLHGFLSSKSPHAEELSAKFVISKTSMHADVLGIPPEMVTENVALVPWSEKLHNRLLWRGHNTGAFYSSRMPWRDSHRLRLIELGGKAEGSANVLAPPGRMNGKKMVGKAAMKQDVGEANPAYFDMAFTGHPIQCEKEICKQIARDYSYGDFVNRHDADRHKFQIDVDGNAWSARFQRLLMSGSLVFKTTLMPEWYNDRIQPWVHYVPIKLDYTDLRDVLAFFAGDIEGEGGRDDLAENIGTSGRKWAEGFYRKPDMVAYVFRLYLEWARLQAPSRSSMSFKYDPSLEVSDT
ncbi:hypothetical protein CspeluHIS016_0114770 [Cutaneotrichosporon spelunceum]|uniref:Glycosyl transferase CAP10 domain-containing protein n=1 Tax=Cutaneotrichosporon spelunceum TaxID=1672016 RepID=A0AAD3Y9H0_9TREE|nr:hypothetical protein CspeluHIS016_0114770 [Cutaneotrichosporon spelunceum]